ncbi:MAG: DUF4258 domain-containing protein [Crenarchaeota archaeon]|nr:DUF4258 domain-containing protein [Thermoproteota archaeon]
MDVESGVRFTRHALERMFSRGIAVEMVLDVLRRPDLRLFDVEADTIVYASTRRKLIVVVAPEGGGKLRVVTVIPCKRVDVLVRRRLSSGRWIPLGGAQGNCVRS